MFLLLLLFINLDDISPFLLVGPDADPGFVYGGLERNFADVAQQSCSDQDNLGLKIGGGGPG